LGAPTGTTKALVVTLPIDGYGRVPSDPSIIDAIIRDRITVRLGNNLDKLIPPGGVVNASDIYLLTDATESGTVINVLLVPFPLEGESYMNFTRSVLCAYDNGYAIPSVLPLDRNNLPNPYTLGHGVNIIDNGNVNNATLANIQGNSNMGEYQSAVITWNSTGVVPANVLSSFPWMLHSALDTGAPGFVPDDYLSFYYIGHGPMSITGNFAAGYFQYS
jgi:hypothetical protein